MKIGHPNQEDIILLIK